MRPSLHTQKLQLFVTTIGKPFIMSICPLQRKARLVRWVIFNNLRWERRALDFLREIPSLSQATILRATCIRSPQKTHALRTCKSLPHPPSIWNFRTTPHIIPAIRRRKTLKSISKRWSMAKRQSFKDSSRSRPSAWTWTTKTIGSPTTIITLATAEVQKIWCIIQMLMQSVRGQVGLSSKTKHRRVT